MTTGAISRIVHQSTENQSEALEKASLQIPDFIRNSFRNLNEVFLELSFFANTSNIRFQGKVVLHMDGDFVNPVGKVFSAVLGCTIQARSISNAGKITSEQGSVCLEASKQFSQFDEGSVEALKGPVRIYTQHEMQMMGLVKASEGIELISKEDAIVFLNSSLITPNKKILIQTSNHTTGIKISQSEWVADSIEINAEKSPLMITTTRIPSGLIVVSSANAKIHRLWQQTGYSTDICAKQIDITESTFGAGVALNGNELVRVDNFHADGNNCPFSIQSQGSLALREFHIRNAKSLSLSAKDLLIHSSTMECNEGLTVKAKDEVILEEGFRALVHQGKVLFETDHLEFSDVILSSKGSQKIKTNSSDFSDVRLETSTGNIKLKTETIGAYEKMIAVSQKGSIKVTSEEDLAFQKTVTFAKKTIFQRAENLVDEASTHGTEGDLTQIADNSLSSIESRLESRQTLLMKSNHTNSISLTAIAQNLIAKTRDEGQYDRADFYAEKRFLLKSKKSFLDLAHADIVAGELFATAAGQIFMSFLNVSVNGQMEWTSRKKGIEVRKSQIKGHNESQAIIFNARQGEVYFDHLQVSSRQKVVAYGKGVRTEKGIMDAMQGIHFQGNSVQGRSSVLSSESGDIVLDGTKALLLDDSYKNAAQGSIVESSEAWISERRNENETEEMVRQSSNLFVTDTIDKAITIQNSAKTLTLTNYKGEAEQKMVLGSKKDSVIQKSCLTAPAINMDSDELWLKGNALQFQALGVQSQELAATKNRLSGDQVAIEAEEALLQKNTLHAGEMRLQADHLTFQKNELVGNLKIETNENQNITNNQFFEGDLQLKSENNLSLHQNTIEVDALTVEGKAVSLSEENITAKQGVFIKGEKVEAQEVKVHSETVDLSASQGNFHDLSLKTAQETQITLDSGSINHTEIASKSYVTIAGKELFLSEVTAKGTNVREQVDELVHTNVTFEAEQTITRDTYRVVIEGGKDQAEQLIEHSGQTLHQNHEIKAQAVEQLAEDLKILNGKVEASEIVWGAKELFGSENKVKAESFDLEANNVFYHKGELESEHIAIQADTMAFPGTEFQGKVHFQPGFSTLNLEKAKVHGSLKVGKSLPLNEFPSVPIPRPRPIPEKTRAEQPHQPRLFPDLFEGEDTTILGQVLLQRGILKSEGNNLLFIGDGTEIEIQRIRNKMAGVTLEEQEILLRNFDNSKDLFGIKHEGAHWTYLRPTPEGEHEEEPTLPDGNCAFNGFGGLGLCDAILGEKLVLSQRQLELFQRHLNLASPTKESMKAWIRARNLTQRQRELQGLLRHIAVAYIRKHEEEIYKEVYEEQLYYAYHYPQNDDTFITHTHIARKFRERNLSKSKLIEWWHAEGKALYFANIRQNAWGSEVEIDALARYFGIYIFWQKGMGKRSIGGKALTGFNQDQTKRFLDLDIGERVGGSFQLHRFASVEVLQSLVEPLPQRTRELVERIIANAFNREPTVSESLEEVRQPTCPIRNEIFAKEEQTLESHSGTIYAHGLEFSGESLDINAAELWMGNSEVMAEKHVTVSAEYTDLTRSHLEAPALQIDSQNLQAPKLNIESQNATLFTSDYSNLHHGNVQAVTFSVHSGAADFSKTSIAANTSIQSKDSVDLSNSIVEGSLNIESKGHLTAPDLVVTGENLTLNSSSIWMGRANVEADQIDLKAQTEISVPNAEFSAQESISLEAKHISAKKFSAKTEEIDVNAERMADFKQAEFEANTFKVQSPNIDLQEAEVAAKQSSLEGSKNVNLNAANIEGSLNVVSHNVIAKELQTSGDIFKVKAQHLMMSEANIEEVNKVKIRTEEEASLQNTHFKVSDGNLTIFSENIQAKEMHIEASKGAEIVVEKISGLQKAKVNASASVNLEAGYLNIEEAKIEGQEIIEKGDFGISAAKSAQVAQTLLKQSSDLVIDNERARLKSGKGIIQKGAYVNRKNSKNSAPLNLMRATLLENQYSEIKGNFDMEAQFVRNEGAVLKLQGGASNIEADYIFNSFQTRIEGNGDLQMSVGSDYEEKSQVNMQGLYRLEAPAISIMTPFSAKDADLKAKGTIAIASGATMGVSDTAILDGSILDNRGKITADKLAIHQKTYHDPGNVTGTAFLELSADSKISLNRSFKTEGSFSLESKQDIEVNQPLDIGGTGIFKTPHNVTMNRVNAVFRNGIQVKVNRFDFNGSNVHVTGPSYVEANQVNFNPDTSQPVEYRSFFRRRRTHFIPSQFTHHGNLHWKVKDTLIDGSHFQNTGRMVLDGGRVRVNSRMYTYAYEVVVGKVSKRNFFGKKKSKKIKETRYQTVIAQLATMQVSEGELILRNASVDVEGGVLLAKKAQGQADKIFVGIRTQSGETPTFLPPFQKASDLPIPKPGGDFRTVGDINLSVNELHVNGYFESTQGKLKVAAKKMLLEKRVVEGRSQVAKIRKWGKISRRWVPVDYIQPGAHIHGAKGTHLHIDEGLSKGGVISSGGRTRITGGGFTEEPVIARKAVHLKPGKVAPWKKCTAYSVRREIEGAQLLGDEVIVDLKGKFSTTASDVVGDRVFIRAGEIYKGILFDKHKSEVSRKATGDKDIYTVTCAEGSIRSINRPLTLIATKGDVYLEGTVGSYKGKVHIEAARDAVLITRSKSADNRVSKTSYSFPRVSYESHRFNTVRIAAAQVFAGNGFKLKAGRKIVVEGVQFDIIGNTEIEAPAWERRGYKVERYHDTEGCSIGLKFFGSSAIGSLIDNRKPFKSAKSLLSEDPALNNFIQLVGGSKDSVEATKKAVMAAVLGFNEVSRFSKAYNNGRLGDSIGHHLGITNEEGEFHPRITLELGASKVKRTWTETLPTQFHIRGNYTEKVGTVRDKGTQFNVTGDMEINNETLILDSEVDTFSQKGSQGMLGITYGPSGWSGSADYTESRSRGKTHIPPRMIAGGNIRMNVKHLVAGGSAHIEGEEVWIKADHISGETVRNTFKQKSFSGGFSTDGRVSASAGHRRSSQAENVMTIKARQHGAIQTNSGHFKGAHLQNMSINPDAKLIFEDVKEYKKTCAFSAVYFGKDPRVSAQDDDGFQLLGDVDFQWQSRKGRVRSAITNGDGTNRKRGKKRNWHIGVPIVTFDSDKLAANIQEIGRVFSVPEVATPVATPKVATPTSPKPKKSPFEEKRPEPVLSVPAKEEPKKEESPKQDEEPVILPTLNLADDLFKKTVKTPVQKSTPKAKTLEEKVNDVAFAMEHMYRMDDAFDARGMAVAIEAVAYPLILASQQWQNLNPLQKRIVLKVATEQFISRSPTTALFVKSIPLIVQALESASPYNPLIGKVHHALTHIDETALNLVKSTGVIDYVSKLYAQYQENVKRQVIENRKWGIDDKMTEQFYQDVPEIIAATGLGALASGLGALPKVARALKPANVRQGAKTLTKELPAKKASTQGLALVLTSKPNLQRFADKIGKVERPNKVAALAIDVTKKQKVPKLIGGKTQPKIKPIKVTQSSQKKVTAKPTVSPRHVEAKVASEPKKPKPQQIKKLDQSQFGSYHFRPLSNNYKPLEAVKRKVQSFVRDDTGKLPGKTTHWTAKSVKKESEFPKFDQIENQQFKPKKPNKTCAEKIKDPVIYDKAPRSENPPKKIAVNQPNQNPLLTYDPHPPGIKELINHIFEIAELESPEEFYSIHALIKAEKQIAKVIRDVSKLGESREAIWLTMIHGEQKRSLLFKIEYFELNPFFEERGNFVARIECAGKSTIVKQKDFSYFIGEVGALDKLNSLGLNNLQFPKIVALGKNGNQYILAKNNLEGITFKSLLETQLMDQAPVACHQFGKGIGELQSKGIEISASIDKLRSIDSLKLLDYHSASLESTKALVRNLNLTPLELDSAYFTMVAIHFERNPSPYTFSLVDLHSNNIIWNSKNSKIGFIDCESVLTSVDHLGRPVSFPEKDFYDFLLELDVQGIYLGLNLRQTYVLKRAFMEGYAAEFFGNISEASNHLFGFSAEVRRISHFAQAFAKGVIKDKEIVENLIQKFNQKVRSNEPGARNVQKWMVDVLEEEAVTAKKPSTKPLIAFAKKFVTEDGGGGELPIKLKNSDEFISTRNLTSEEVGLPSELFQKTEYEHRATMTLYKDRLKVRLDWVKLPPGTFQLETYVDHLLQLAQKYNVEKLEFEALFTNPKFCEKWKSRFGENLVSSRTFRTGNKRKELCQFEFAVDSSKKSAPPKKRARDTIFNDFVKEIEDKEITFKRIMEKSGLSEERLEAAFNGSVKLNAEEALSLWRSEVSSHILAPLVDEEADIMAYAYFPPVNMTKKHLAEMKRCEKILKNILDISSRNLNPSDIYKFYVGMKQLSEVTEESLQKLVQKLPDLKVKSAGGIAKSRMRKAPLPEEAKNVYAQVRFYLSERWLPKSKLVSLMHLNYRETYKLLRKLRAGEKVTWNYINNFAEALNISIEKITLPLEYEISAESKALISFFQNSKQTLEKVSAETGISTERLYSVINRREGEFTTLEMIQLSHTGVEPKLLEPFAAPEVELISAFSEVQSISSHEIKNFKVNFETYRRNGWMTRNGIARALKMNESTFRNKLKNLEEGRESFLFIADIAKVLGLDPKKMLLLPKNLLSQKSIDLIDYALNRYFTLSKFSSKCNISEKRLLQVINRLEGKFNQEEYVNLWRANVREDLIIPFASDKVNYAELRELFARIERRPDKSKIQKFFLDDAGCGELPDLRATVCKIRELATKKNSSILALAFLSQSRKRNRYETDDQINEDFEDREIKNQVTPDGSIEPATKVFLQVISFPFYSSMQSMLMSVFKSFSLTKHIAQYMDVELPRSFNKRHALVLTADSDYNGAFILAINRLRKTLTFFELENSYDVKYTRVYNLISFCDAIDEETKEKGPINLLIIRGHGSQGSITLDPKKFFFVCSRQLKFVSSLVLRECGLILKQIRVIEGT